MMKIALGNDHAGFRMKEIIKGFLKKGDYLVEDLGTNSEEMVDYPSFAKDVALLVSSGECHRGILICGTGIGMSIMANKVSGVRAALCHDPLSARYSRNHNDSNILTMGERIIGRDLALEIVKVWLKSPFLEERHQRRLQYIKEWEEKKT